MMLITHVDMVVVWLSNCAESYFVYYVAALEDPWHLQLCGLQSSNSRYCCVQGCQDKFGWESFRTF